MFSVGVPAISKHLKNIFEEKELDKTAVVSKMEITAEDGKRYNTDVYSLDAIIAVGYRMNSKKATNFRIWATKILKELAKIKLISDKMRVFNQVILKGNFKSKGKNKINLFDYWNFYFKSSSYISNLIKIKQLNLYTGKNYDRKSFDCEVDVYDMSVIIDNLISNAVDFNATIIDVCFENNKIKFFSNTKTINKENLNSIFELGFTTKEGGTGIGLYQIKRILNKYKWNIIVENKQDGVEFIIEVGGKDEK